MHPGQSLLTFSDRPRYLTRNSRERTGACCMRLAPDPAQTHIRRKNGAVGIFATTRLILQARREAPSPCEKPSLWLFFVQESQQNVLRARLLQLPFRLSLTLSQEPSQPLSDTSRERTRFRTVLLSSQRACSAPRPSCQCLLLPVCLFVTCFLQSPFHTNAADLSAPVIPSPRATRKLKPTSTSLL